MLIGIYTNKSRDPDLKITSKFIELLKKNNINFCVSNLLAEDLSCPRCYDSEKLAENADILALFGGDGTVLSIIAAAAKNGKPILAINTGHLGFVTGAESNELEKVVNALRDGKYTVDRRAMLEAAVCGNSYFALNEIVLLRENYTSVIKIDAYNNGRFIDRYTADGVMVATPTGSTAYALSAGGPVLSPEVKAFELIAVSPHSLTSRPVVFPDTDVVTLKVAQDKACVLIYDGIDIPHRISDSDEVRISRAPFDAQFLRIGQHNFYERLMTKMAMWTKDKLDK